MYRDASADTKANTALNKVLEVQPSNAENVDTYKGLVPQPSSHPQDPLNWPLRKKCSLFAILCFGIFVGTAANTSALLATTVQSKTFDRTPTVVSYTVSGQVGGLIVGPLFLIPLSSFIGSTSVIFWSLLITSLFNVWASKANHRDDLISFGVARGLTGLFAQIPLVLAPGFIINTFFLHQRGRAFAISSSLFTLATVMGPSFVGFQVQVLPWPDSFWWLVAGNATAAVLIFTFMDETAFNRQQFTLSTPDVTGLDRSWLASRIATFFPGIRATLTTGSSLRNVARSAKTAALIAFSPITILAGMFTMIDFAWNVVLAIELSIYLQEPYKPSKGDFGYGYNARSTSLFYIALWMGMLSGQLYGIALNDRVPLGLWRRAKSKDAAAPWKPEYRLHTAWIPGLLFFPVGVGLVGASLQKHYHFMVLALGSFLITCGAPSVVSISVNYIVETFKSHPQEVSTVMNVYRMTLALITPFIIDQWTEVVGVGWVWGMMGFLSVGAFIVGMLPLMLFGAQLRRWSLLKLDTDADDALKGEEEVIKGAGMGH